MLKKGELDLAVLDLDLPDIHGYDLIERVRNNSKSRHLPIIVLTGHDDTEAIEKAYTVGATSFVTKPVNWAQFGYQVRYILRSDERRKALQNAKFEAEKANEHKDNFIKVLGHELRTPLHHIIGFSEILQTQIAKRSQNDDLLEYVDSIADAGHTLLSSLTDIMLYSRLLSDDIELVEGEYEAYRIIGIAVGSVKARAKLKNITIDYTHTLNDCSILCDFQMMTRVLISLLDNAIKYSHENGKIQIAMERSQDGSLMCSVIDFGKGMDIETLKNCQSAFLLEENILSHSVDGLGMGLPIAKAIVKMHGGSSQIFSKIEGGTKVIVTLPTDRVIAEKKQQSPAATRSTG